jgi:hypothetical protein
VIAGLERKLAAEVGVKQCIRIYITVSKDQYACKNAGELWLKGKMTGGSNGSLKIWY